ncbi:MAG TPA: CdaR family protein [Polyangiaceae bacterium]|nr:CdaR family protein [Polyangiaceae bacterium]
MTALLSWFLGFLKESFTENIGLKALSLSIAVGLFAILYGKQDEQLRTLPVTVVLRPPAEGSDRELMTAIPPNIHLTLRGPARALDRAAQEGLLPIEIDLRQGNKEQIVFDPREFKLPPDLKVSIIDPPSIDLDWEDVVVREIPVQASISGQPASGYVVKGEPEPDPATLAARGPRSLVEVVQSARLAPFDVSGLSEGVHRRRIALDGPPPRVKFIGPTSVNVTVTIARRLAEVHFDSRPVEIAGVASGTSTPRAVNVVVYGPPEVVHSLKPDQVVPRADLSKLPGLDLKEQRHGAAVVKLSVELTRAEVEIQPPSVNVKW